MYQLTVDGAFGRPGATAAPLAATELSCTCAIARFRFRRTAVWSVSDETTRLGPVSYNAVRVGEINGDKCRP